MEGSRANRGPAPRADEDLPTRRQLAILTNLKAGQGELEKEEEEGGGEEEEKEEEEEEHHHQQQQHEQGSAALSRLSRPDSVKVVKAKEVHLTEGDRAARARTPVAAVAAGLPVSPGIWHCPRDAPAGTSSKSCAFAAKLTPLSVDEAEAPTAEAPRSRSVSRDRTLSALRSVIPRRWGRKEREAAMQPLPGMPMPPSLRTALEVPPPEDATCFERSRDHVLVFYASPKARAHRIHLPPRRKPLAVKTGPRPRRASQPTIVPRPLTLARQSKPVSSHPTRATTPKRRPPRAPSPRPSQNYSALSAPSPPVRRWAGRSSSSRLACRSPLSASA